jgi:hypothetical protein
VWCFRVFFGRLNGKEFFKSDSFQLKFRQDILPSIQKRGIFQTEKLDYWMKNLESANPRELEKLWLLVNFEILAGQYLD